MAVTEDAIKSLQSASANIPLGMQGGPEGAFGATPAALMGGKVLCAPGKSALSPGGKHVEFPMS